MVRWFLLMTLVTAPYAAPLPLMPLPRIAVVSPGGLPINSSFRIATTGYSDFRLEGALKRLASRVSRQTGIPLLPTTTKPVTLLVECRERGSDYPTLGEDESYQLDVAASGARLQAHTVTGVLRGLETFAQLIGPGAEGFEVPSIHIEDRPRFAWRGLTLDVSRHWMPLAVVERNLDAMAAVKLNVFHWHLSDDQGFRIESKRYPKLQLSGSDGNFYTQAEVRQVIAYARDRAIRVIPEFDMPGHTAAWFAGYPELASAPGPYAVERKWGVFQPTMDPSREETYAFLDGFIGEMAALFPDPYFHVGGDEVEDTQWKHSASIQAFARDHELTNNHDLQAYFNRRVEKLVKKHGKIMIGWDEVLGPHLAADTVIQSWRGQSSLAEAVAKGYRSVLSFGYYLDHLDPASVLYANDPMDGKALELTPVQAARILGGEACMWSEYVSPETVDSRIWPRMAAIAERFWSPREVTNVESMYTRMEVVSRSLEWTGLEHRSNYEVMLDRLAGGRSAEPLRILADASEAQGIAGRRTARQYTSLVPLNRFVDAVRPESEWVRRLEGDVAEPRTNPGAAAELRAAFTAWAQLADVPLPDGRGSLAEAPSTRNRDRQGAGILIAELVPLAERLAAVGKIGLRALDYIEKKEPAPTQWLAQEGRELDRLEEPVAEVRLAGIRPVRLLLAQLKPQSLANASVRCGNEPLCNRPATVLNWTSTAARPNITLKQMLWVH
ncbi:MAG TPA: family 20 glycosylhydrolase [Bryobacteraceae bacterium]|nr:family 20 glycosylhydrolase [Bryobacteraceae bacterium]